MKNAAIRFAVLSGAILVITMPAIGIGVYQMDEDLIRITAYIALPCLALLYIAALVPRFSVSKCLSYGNIFRQMQPITLTAGKRFNRR